ncbi:Glutamine--tRNA ligase [Tepidimonas sediminis]|uniref:Glutamine--tRNA ligase n=1 Tax=Tepidimonas sediminis TaxID=2588941 RepID=A0A554WK67_9BURK|nr:glutamine--tRNA ligase [Tepidimonas sediminis]TSE23971.1 Glutamine--tRNA ligase [Tepidimonas sediminis]
MSEHAPHPHSHHAAASSNFLRQIIERDLAAGRHQGRPWGGSPGDADHHARGLPDPARIRTRFPPEPNGYPHIGHAKSIWINFSLAQEYGGVCHMRFDDTNPEKEEQEYVEAILDAVRWLGWSWHAHGTEHLYYASDYFDTMARAARYLIETGHAYVDEQTPEQLRATRGTLTEPGTESPWRHRPVEESLRRWEEMLAGRHPDGAMVVRARIDMASPNLNLRDPAIYRIKHAAHHNTGTRWCVYPMYTFAHPIEDALENITHSICTLEFEDQRPFYDWLLARLVPLLRAPQFARARTRIEGLRAQGVEAAKEFALRCHNAAARVGANTEAERSMAALFARWEHDRDAVLRDLDAFFELLLAELHQFTPLLAEALTAYEPEPFDLPHQYEFARLNLTYVVTSKRKLKALVDEGVVAGWDDPRLPTLAGLRRRGYTPSAIRLFCERTGVSKANGWIDYGTLEVALRDDLEEQAPRAMAVLDPLELRLTNWAEVFGDERHREPCRAPVHPHHPGWGERAFHLGPRVWIERDDFMEQPPKGYHRLYPGNRVRLKYGYVVECTGCEKDADGRVTAVLARLVPDTKSGTPGADAVKVKGVITWVGADEAVAAEIRLYDRLFTDPQPDAGGKDFKALLNPDSLRVVRGWVEPGLGDAAPEQRFQFERHGYFVADRLDHQPGRPVFNRIATLKDGWGGR